MLLSLHLFYRELERSSARQGGVAALGPHRPVVAAKSEDASRSRDADRIREEQRFRSQGVRLPQGRVGGASGRGRRARRPTAPCSSPPSDRLVADRARAEALWEFRYRLEMFVPKAKREFGYYVLPLLVGDQARRPRRAGSRPQDRRRWSCSAPGVYTSRLDEALDDLAAWFGAASIKRSMDFETRAIHEGQEPDPATGAIVTPTTRRPPMCRRRSASHKGYDYVRVANPTARRCRPRSRRSRTRSTESR